MSQGQGMQDGKHPQGTVPVFRIALIAALFPLLAGVFGHDPWTPDEPRVAATSKEMVTSGNWIVPTLGGDDFVEQPPLYHILAGLSWKFLSPVLGDTGSMRFVSLLCGLGTLLLAARIAFLLAGARTAALVAVILATSPAMIIASHSIRVDASLLFFVTASIAVAGEAYLRGKPWLLPVAGLCAAAGLLSKGPIALAFIGPAILPFAWRRLFLGMAAVRPGTPSGDARPERWLWPHAVAAVAAVALAGAWMIALKLSSESAWNAWFWDNQLGRLTGSVEVLGHHHAGKPHYYLECLLIGMAPWSLALILWARNVWRSRETKPWRDPALQSIMAWGFGALFLLTISVTKRDIYLAPALPAFCIMAAKALESAPAAWFRWWAAAWAGILLAASAMVSVTPLLFRIAAVRSLRIPPATVDWMSAWHTEHVAAFALVLAGIVLIVRRRRFALGPMAVPAGVIALSLAALLTVLTVGINQSKNLREPAERFAWSVPRVRQARACGWALTETDRGALSFHAAWQVPSLRAESELVSVLEGRHPRFNSVVSSLPPDRIPALAGTPCVVRASVDLGDARHPRPLHWIVKAD